MIRNIIVILLTVLFLASCAFPVKKRENNSLTVGAPNQPTAGQVADTDPIAPSAPNSGAANDPAVVEVPAGEAEGADGEPKIITCAVC